MPPNDPTNQPQHISAETPPQNPQPRQFTPPPRVYPAFESRPVYRPGNEAQRDSLPPAQTIDQQSPLAIQPQQLAEYQTPPPELQSPNLFQQPSAPLSQPTPKPVRSKRFRARLLIYAAGVVVVLLLSTLALAIVANVHQVKPNVIFEDALSKALNSPVTSMQSDESGMITRTTVSFDSSDHPIVSSTGSLSVNSTILTAQSYASANNSYLEYTHLPAAIVVPAALDHWVSLRTDGTEASGVPSALADFTNPGNELAGYVIAANLSPQESMQTVKNLLAAHAYSYNISRITHITSAGSQYLKYPIVMSTAVIAQFDRSIERAQGISGTAADSAIAALTQDPSVSATMYISVTSHQLVRIDIQNNGSIKTILYTYPSNDAQQQPPLSPLSWAKFTPIQQQIEQQARLAATNVMYDRERKADLVSLQHYIENYFTQTSAYPTLADLNSQIWVSVNMQGINPSVFKDPKGVNMMLSGTPAANIYSYTPLGAGGAVSCADMPSNSQGSAIPPCVTYSLVATLSDGTHYTLTNQK
jgi:hypothetical protein